MKTGRRLLVVLLLATAACSLGPPDFTLRAVPDRNVLLITIDTLRADVVGSYGGRAITPNLDRLATRGARFDFAHAHAVVTLPSHASILTGRYPYEHGIRDNTGYRLAKDQRTAATRLKAHGFATGAFIGGFPLDRRFGLGTGFDLYDDRLDRGGDDAERERRADAVVASALDWIGRQRGRWFAWVHLYDPHVLYEAPSEWASRFPSEPYLAEVSWTDHALGPLLDRLGGAERPTIVVVTSDHGEGLGDHGESTHGIFAYESTLRVPLVVTELGARVRETRGITIGTPVRHVDLLPTLLDAAGAAVEGDVAGTSLRAMIDEGAAGDRPAYFEAMTPAVTRGWAPLRGVIAGREKYVDLPIVELYDLAGDAGETRNAAPGHPGRVRALRALLEQFDVAPPSRARAESAETIERLRSLGYVAGGSAVLRERYTEEDDPKRLIGLEQMLERAARSFREGRPDEAIDLYRGVIAKRKDTEDAYRKLALLYWRTGRPRAAIGTLEEALRNGVTQREVRNRLAQYFAETGNPRRAIALLEPDAGDDPDALVGLGNAYMLGGRPRDALATFHRLLTLDPDNGLAYQNIGAVQLQAGDRKGAELALRRALRLDPNLSGAWTTLGVVLAETGRKPEAIDAWLRAVQIDPVELNALYNLTVNLAGAGRLDEARRYGERFIAAAPPGASADVAAVRRILNQRP
jgi:arylsulfatase A-like enzyme/tetratricopeptide (TPR) repeat protein